MNSFKSTIRAGILVALLASAALRGSALEVYVAPAGDDANAGTLEKPFATIGRAQREVGPGDTVYLRGGTYAMRENQITAKERIFARVNVLDKSGTSGRPINYFAYQAERPVFDLSAVKPAMRVTAFYVSGSWVHIK